MGKHVRAAVGALVLGLLASLLPSSPAHAGRGDLDLSFGGGDGLVTFGSGSTGGDPDRHLTVTPSVLRRGPLDVVASVGLLDNGSSGALLALVDAGGAPVTTFSGDGSLVLAPSTPGEKVIPSDVAVLADGRVAVLVQRGPTPTSMRSTVELFTAAGLPDAGFSSDGVQLVDINDDGLYSGGASTLTVGGTGPALALFVAGVVLTDDPTPPAIYIRRVGLDGTIDSAYGSADGSANGWIGVPFIWADLPPARDQARLISGLADGSLLWTAASDPAGPGQGVVVGKLTATGAVDASYGAAGQRYIPLTPNGGIALFQDTPLALEQQGGKAYVLVDHNRSYAVAARLTSAGALDTSYSGDGIATVQVASVADQHAVSATLEPGQQVTFRLKRPSSLVLLRLDSAGAADTSFGANGLRTATYTPTGAIPGRIAAAGGGVIVDSTVAAAPAGQQPGRDLQLARIATNPTPPGPAMQVGAVAGDGMATVSWAPPASDGGSPITGYTVTSNPSGGSCATGGTVTACTVTGLTDGQAYTFSVKAGNAFGTGPAAASNTVTPADGAGAFVPLASPKRIVDSRDPSGDTDDEQQERFGALPGGTTRTIPVAGRVGLPAGVENVVLSVAAVAPSANGFITVFPCGTARPLASSMNFTTGVTLANTVITKLSATGTVCLYSNVTTNVVIDVSGSLTSEAFAALPSPKRIVDSRNPAGDTDDEQQERFGALPGGSTRTIPITGRVGLAGDVENVVLTVAAVAPGANGFFTLYPCGTPKPLASSMNFTKGTTLANTVITKLSATGTVCVYSNVTTDVVIDVSGSLTPAAFAALPSPQRIVDSRNPAGDTDDEQQERFGPLTGGTTRTIPVAGRVGLAGDVENVVLSVAAVTPGANGFFTLYPCGTPKPLASSMNFTKGTTLANTVITKLSAAGTVCVYTSATTNIVIDVSGSLR